MDKDVLSAISESIGTFSKGQRRIASYILDNYDKAAFMTASKLGETVGVSESTVVRFAADLGYDGYPEMRKALQEIIKNCLTSVQRIEVSKDLIDNNNLPASVLSSDIEKIRYTMEGLDQASFDAAVDAIVHAKNMYVSSVKIQPTRYLNRLSACPAAMRLSPSAFRAIHGGPSAPCAMRGIWVRRSSESRIRKRLLWPTLPQSSFMQRVIWFLSWTLLWRR